MQIPDPLWAKAGGGDAPASETRRGFSICSDDLPEPFTAPWMKRAKVADWVDSAEFAKIDDPDRLRLAGSTDVASALIQLAESSFTDPRRVVREAANLLHEFFAEEHYRHDSLDFFIGISRRDGKGGLGFRDTLARRNEVVAEMGVADRWAGLGDRDAAKAMKRELGRWMTAAWPRLKGRRSSRPALEPDAFFWRIAQTGRGLPSENDLTAAIKASRLKSRDFYPPLL